MVRKPPPVPARPWRTGGESGGSDAIDGEKGQGKKKGKQENQEQH